jgi:hypothetical protein
LQAVDRGIFGSFETFLKQDSNCWVNINQNRKVTRVQLRILIGGAWNRAVSVANSMSAFKATGIFPLDHFFSDRVAFEAGEATEPTEKHSVALDSPNLFLLYLKC